MISVYINRIVPICIARHADSDVEQVVFDITAWRESYPALTRYRVEVTSPDGVIYIPRTELTRDKLIWPVTAHDTAAAGNGLYQVVAEGDNGERKTSGYDTFTVNETMPGTAGDVPPDPAKPWVDKVMDAAQDVMEAVVHPPIIGENGNWLLWSFDESAYVDSGVKASGEGGGSGPGEPGLPGKDGGYYVPNVNNDGDLSWTPSESDMPGVPAVNIKGRDGSDANVTAENVTKALGYTPADHEDVERLTEEIGELKESGGAGVTVDDTLIESGKAADAKVVGDELNAIKTAAFDYVTGKNLYNPATVTQGAIQADGTIRKTGVYEDYDTSDYIAVTPNTDYTISLWLLTGNPTPSTSRKMYTLFDAEKNVIADSHQSISGEKSVTFNTASAAYVRVAAYVRQQTTKEYEQTIQVEKGSTYTPYEEFSSKEMVLKCSNRTIDILRGKKWAVFGDSFTNSGGTGTKLTNGQYSGYNYVYPYIIGNRTGLEVLKYFEGGRTLAFPAEPGEFTNSATNPTDSMYYQTVPEDVDYITFYLGINDGHHANADSGTDGESTEGVIPIGTIDDTDTTTYYGAWNVVLTWLIEHRPFAHIGILVSNGCDSDDYRTAQIAIAKKYGIPYIDLNGDERTPVMIRSTNPDISSAVKTLVNIKQAVDYDGTVTGNVNRHPNDAAHEYESRFIENWLRTI